MTLADFFNNLLVSQTLTFEQEKELQDHRSDIETLLREKFGYEPVIKYAGSLAKHTMIAESYDLDIACYFPDDCGKTIKQIYDETKAVLDAIYYIDPKTSAIRIKGKKSDGRATNYHIDVVPGRFIDQENHDVFLYLSTADGERIKTNLKVHINAISTSENRDVIKLLKLWKVRNRLEMRTFVLELFVIRALEDFSGTTMSSKIKRVFEYLRDEIASIRLEDPANSANVVSELLTENDKALIAAKAVTMLQELEKADTNDKEILAWSQTFQKQEYIYPTKSGVVIKRSPEPHSNPIKQPQAWRS